VSHHTRFHEHELWDIVSEIFQWFPIVANCIVCVHGGLSKELPDTSELQEIVGRVDIPNHGLVCQSRPGHNDCETGLDFAWTSGTST
jgi:hypothetical protein